MKFKTEDGTVIDTKKMVRKWKEATDWNGNNHISRATGSQWEHETLCKSSKGRYYLWRSSQWEGSLDSAEFISDMEAARWLLLNDRPVPDDLSIEAKAVEE